MPVAAILFPGGATSRAEMIGFGLCSRLHPCETLNRIRRPQGIGDMNDNEERPVTIIVGRVWKRKGGESEGVHVMLVAPDDDSAVRMTLDALAKEGYAEVELDQIGDMEGVPDEEPHLSAYQGATEGEVSIVTFDEPL